MTSLTEVYDGGTGGTNLRRLYAGTVLVAIGGILAVIAVLISTTTLFSESFSDPVYGPVLWAGVLAGTGVPLALLGVFTVLPASRRVQAAAVIGTSICLFGVVLFWQAYPSDWRGHGNNYTLYVSAVYLLGLFTALWCLFTGVVNFKTRNDPGGMLEMNVTLRNQTKVVEVESEGGGLGGVGFLGSTPDGEVETQTNDKSSSRSSPAPNPVSAPASDGGAVSRDIQSPLDDPGTGDGQDGLIVDGPEQPTPTDRYCGNCTHFDYVRTSSGITPYCGQFDETMDDMDACEEWTPNR